MQEKASILPAEKPTLQPTTTQSTTTTPTLDEEKYCISNETGAKMSISEARNIAIKSECVEQGSLKDIHLCNEYTGTWWIDLQPLIEEPGCNPACVVNVNNKTAEINWRCTGAMLPNSSES